MIWLEWIGSPRNHSFLVNINTEIRPSVQYISCLLVFLFKCDSLIFYWISLHVFCIKKNVNFNKKLHSRKHLTTPPWSTSSKQGWLESALVFVRLLNFCQLWRLRLSFQLQKTIPSQTIDIFGTVVHVSNDSKMKYLVERFYILSGSPMSFTKKILCLYETK